MLVKQVDLMTKTDTEDKAAIQMRSYAMKSVYSKPPHITVDNFFSSEKLMDYLGAKGYGMTATCAHNNMPASIKPYMHAVKVDSTLQQCKAMRF